MNTERYPVKRALLSVYDKIGIVEMAQLLHDSGVELVSSTGTYKKLTEAGLPVKDVGEITGVRPCLDHRVATLHPLIHGPILFRRDADQDYVDGSEVLEIDLKQAAIDLVVVNMYPVQEIIRKGGSMADVVKNTDIGGPALLRGAAKNHQWVSAVVQQQDYLPVAHAIKELGGLTLFERTLLAGKVYDATGQYDLAIAGAYANHLRGQAKQMRR